MAPIEVRLFGETQDAVCPCGCEQAHRLLRGQATRPGSGQFVLFLCLLAQHHDERHIWLAIGSGPWGEDDSRDCFCSVESWLADGSLISRTTEPHESPFAAAQQFKEGGGARIVAREEVIGHPERKAWLFEWVDELNRQVEPIRKFVLGTA
jgi:hypothetical protein